jgi:ankyrin repeat protein
MDTLLEYYRNKIDADILVENIKSNILDDKKINRLLHRASYEGHIQIIKYLLETYKNININDFLIWTSERGHIQIIKYLLEKYENIDINKLGACGNSSLHFASGSNYEITEILLEYGANVNIMDNNCLTPLYFALNGRNLEIIKLLIKNGADINISDKDNISPLHISIRINRKDITEILINNGANINAIDRDHKTPLYYACNKDNIYYYALNMKYNLGKYEIKIVEYLLQNGADPSIPDKNGNTVLHITSVKNDHECTKLLLQYGVDTTVINNEGIKAIDVTEDNEIIDIIQYHTPIILK